MPQNPYSAGARVEIIAFSRTAQDIGKRLALRAGLYDTVEPQFKRFSSAINWGGMRPEWVADIANRSDIVVTLLDDDQTAKDVLIGPSGLLGAARSGLIVLELSAIMPWTAREIREYGDRAGIEVFDGVLVSERRDLHDKSWNVYLNTDGLVNRTLSPLLEAFFQQVVPLGNTGVSKTVKILNDLLLAVNVAVVDEAIALGEGSLIGRDELITSILKGSGANDVVHSYYEARMSGPIGPAIGWMDLQLRQGLKSATELAQHFDHSLYFGELSIASFIGAGPVKRANPAVPLFCDVRAATAPSVTESAVYKRTDATRIGVIGLGGIGRAVARTLMNHGNVVVGYDVAPKAITAAMAEQIPIAASSAAVAQECELILVAVWDDDALRKVIFGADGILTSASFAGCVIDLSTTSVVVAQEIGNVVAERHATFLDGAVIGGGVPAARAGKSPIVVAGNRKAFDRYLPVLCQLGSCDYVGKQGNAKAIKIANNFLVGIVTAANAEALSLGVAAGVNLDTLVQCLSALSGNSMVLESYMGRYINEGIYGEGLIGHQLMAKDLSLACDLSEAIDYPAIFPHFGRQLYLACKRALGANAAFPTVFDYFRRLAEASISAADNIADNPA